MNSSFFHKEKNLASVHANCFSIVNLGEIIRYRCHHVKWRLLSESDTKRLKGNKTIDLSRGRCSADYNLEVTNGGSRGILCGNSLSAIVFSQKFTVENTENLESVKSIAESNFKIRLIINIQSFHDKEILQIFHRSDSSLYASLKSSYCLSIN